MQQANLNLSWNANTTFYGYVADNNIYTNLGEQVGVNLAKYNEVEQALIKCKDRLIELGEIKVPKTPDEIIKEQSEMIDKQNLVINQMLETCKQLQKQIKGGEDEHGILARDSELSTGKHKRKGDTSADGSSKDSRPNTNKD